MSSSDPYSLLSLNDPFWAIVISEPWWAFESLLKLQRPSNEFLLFLVSTAPKSLKSSNEPFGSQNWNSSKPRCWSLLIHFEHFELIIWFLDNLIPQPTPDPFGYYWMGTHYATFLVKVNFEWRIRESSAIVSMNDEFKNKLFLFSRTNKCTYRDRLTLFNKLGRLFTSLCTRIKETSKCRCS